MQGLILITPDELERIVDRAVRSAVKSVINQEPQRELMTKAELADYLRCSVSKVNAYMGKGLPSEQFGEHPRFRKSDVDRWLRNERVQKVQQTTAEVV